MSDSEMSEQHLLEGAWYALEQAGRLLRSASMLFDSGDSSTALALAMFGREELGRCKLLMARAAEVRSGSSITASQVTKRTEDHVKKQEAAALSIVVRSPPGSAQAIAADIAGRLDSSDAERGAALEKVRAAMKATEKRQPQTRHDDRCSALYVDLTGSGSDWRRPAQILRQYVRDSIIDAVNDYAIQRDQVISEGIARSLPPERGAREMFEARQRMQTPVDLPGLYFPTTA